MRTKVQSVVIALILAILLIAMVPSNAIAQDGTWVESFFDVSVIDLHNVVSNDDNIWYEYPQQDGTTWWNTWFYNDPPVEGGKEVDLTFTYDLIDPAQPGYVEVTINWSTLDYPETGPGGLPPMPGQEMFIERLSDNGTTIWEFWLDPGAPCGCFNYSGWLPINYNPEWVSIDVRGYNVDLCGQFYHICRPIPEIATIALTSLGLIALGGYIWWRRRESAVEVA